MSLCFSTNGGLRMAVTALAFATFVAAAHARKKDPEFATGPNDPVLRGQIGALAPGVNPEEARRVAEIAYTTGRELMREWKMVWPPGLHNFLVNTKQRKGGLCFQFAEKLLLRLSEQKWETVEFHWAESFETTMSEHNVIVVTAKGHPLSRGIILDNWRYGGRLVWGRVIDDPHYQWHENKPQFNRVLSKRAALTPSPSVAASPNTSAPSEQPRK
jgi:hypothetical protein